MASLLCLGRRTITGLLTTSGQQFADWSAAYRLFERERFDVDRLFAPLRRAVLDLLGDDEPLVVVLDDTRLPKKGRKVSDASWRHDTQGPQFLHQILWAQRLVQLAAVCPPAGDQPPRTIPIDAALQRVPKKPSAKAPAEKHEAYREAVVASGVGLLAVDRLQTLRQGLDAQGQTHRTLIVAVDGGFTNRTVLTRLPARTIVIGRLRKDAKLFAPPPEGPPTRGRKRLYGTRLPTPEQLLADPAVPCLEVQAQAAGRVRTFRIKTIQRCRWSKVGGDKDLRLLVVAPLSLHPHDKGRTLYFAHPGYLVCTDPSLSPQSVLQGYVHRWEIEVNFREEKTLLGVGQAQVRQRQAVQRAPQLQIAAYALLLLAARRCGPLDQLPPRPKWRQSEGPPARITTGQFLSLLRAEIWRQGPGLSNKTDFVLQPLSRAKPLKNQNTLASAVIYASG